MWLALCHGDGRRRRRVDGAMSLGLVGRLSSRWGCVIGIVTSRNITSWLVTSCRVTSCHVLSCHTHVRCQTSCHAMSCHLMSCHVMSCRVMSCHIMSCHIMSYHVISYLIRFYCIISHFYHMGLTRFVDKTCYLEAKERVTDLNRCKKSPTLFFDQKR